jgi:DNA polymerase elongation subunit (family B)
MESYYYMITLWDYKSLYPSMMIGGNLFSPDPSGWRGQGVYPSSYINDTDGIIGTYSKKRGVIEKVILDLYEERMRTPKSDPKNLAIKILINCCYGLLGSPKFKSIYNRTTAADVTAMARRSIKFARTFLEERNYEIAYIDTDSLFIVDRSNDIKRLEDCIKYINETQKKDFNIPFPHHGLVMEAVIKRMYFFRDDNGKFIKKHYLYVKDNDEVVIKGINIKRGNTSRISKLFFEEVIKTKILKNKYAPYEPEVLLKELKQFVKGREELLQKRFRTKPVSHYKAKEGEESNALSAQISKKYGAGEHWMIGNKRIGIGKDVRYAPLKELQEKYGEKWIDQVRFDIYMKELNEFVIWNKRNSIEKVDRKRV